LWKQTVILNFDGPNGSLPYGAPIQGGSGALYGTTYYGGSYGYGIVYMLTPPLNAGKNWTFTSLYNFSGPDGEHPASGLTEDASGNLYGTSVAGGTLGGGTAFELSPPVEPGGSWTQTILYNFTTTEQVTSALLFLNGTLYGTTWDDGAFSLSPPATVGDPWTETVLNPFNVPADGLNLGQGLITGPGGGLYSSSVQGGIHNNGVVFELSPPTGGTGYWTESILHKFIGTDGMTGYGGLAFDSAGNLHGFASGGGSTGCSLGCGTIFELKPSTVPGGIWTSGPLYKFSGPDGYTPLGAPLIRPDGTIYGVTALGGAYNSGTVFQYVP
jgi:uncharacterized repeat protein (TIGR03803 family)